MTGFKVYDMGGITSTVMKFKLIYTKVFGLLLRFYELLTIIGCIDALEAFFIISLTVFLPRPVISATCLFV